jgi:hypothetical protein
MQAQQFGGAHPVELSLNVKRPLAAGRFQLPVITF